MRFDQDKTYPLCGRYLRIWMNPDVLQKKYPTVWQAFVELTEDKPLASEALTHGRGPLVRIVSVPGTANGQHTPGVDEVRIDPLVADQYEKGRDPKFKDPGWMVWESTVLHEIVHWARYKGKKSKRLAGDLEAGEEFEKRAYGKNIHCGCKI
ncbi:MAG TPA: hypothetical protein VFG47_01520 [Geminicoccaceae bacterium]|nr:hypothetical protein [Geminicoccaceae bacterium]